MLNGDLFIRCNLYTLRLYMYSAKCTFLLVMTYYQLRKFRSDTLFVARILKRDVRWQWAQNYRFARLAARWAGKPNPFLA